MNRNVIIVFMLFLNFSFNAIQLECGIIESKPIIQGLTGLVAFGLVHTKRYKQILRKFINYVYPFNDSDPLLEEFLQPNFVFDDTVADMNNKLCARNCTKWPKPRTCYYRFVVEQYHTMGPACYDCGMGGKEDDCIRTQCVPADGVERTILTINRMIPGPTIQVCVGDRIIVDVVNEMLAKSVTIHWHGLLQKEKPYMDGVAYATQCPINEGATFRYDFTAAKEGTHFYHSHMGSQVLDGLSGVLIIRKENNPAPVYYDYDMFDHTIHIMEWMHVLSDAKFPGANKDPSMKGLKADSYLINGRGSYTYPNNPEESTHIPLTRFTVKKDKKYRFRIIALTGLDCTCKITFQDHYMTVIATDGYPIRAVIVQALHLSAGESYDVVIDADQPIGAYWIRVQGESDCKAAVQNAVLEYDGRVNKDPTGPITDDLFTFNQPSQLITSVYEDKTILLLKGIEFAKELNNFYEECKYGENICTHMLRSPDKVPEVLLREPNKKHVYEYKLGFDKNEPEYLYQEHVYHRHYLPTTSGATVVDTINKISNIYPPFLTYTNDFSKYLCRNKCEKLGDIFCECFNLEEIGYGAVVEILVTNEFKKMGHPVHLHGHNFRVLQVGTASDRKPEINRPLTYEESVYEYAVKKDNVTVPPGGYVLLRFLADNPGMWMFHCHIVFHQHMGMSVVFQVAKKKFKDLPKNWPTCGNYMPVLDIKGN